MSCTFAPIVVCGNINYNKLRSRGKNKGEKEGNTHGRCLREMGTPQFGDPKPHIPSDMEIGWGHITKDTGP